jgi:hypothetical protein
VTYPAAGPQPPRDALAGKLKRTEIQRSPSSIPGRDIVQVLTEIPVGVESGWHIHPGEEVGGQFPAHGFWPGGYDQDCVQARGALRAR